MGLPHCPTCGCVLQIRQDGDPYIDCYGNTDADDCIDRSAQWLGALSFLSWLALRLAPWVKRHRWCPRCRRIV